MASDFTFSLNGLSAFLYFNCNFSSTISTPNCSTCLFFSENRLTGMASKTSFAITIALIAFSGSFDNHFTRANKSGALFSMVCFCRCCNSALNSIIKYSLGNVFNACNASNKSAAIFPEPAPNSIIFASLISAINFAIGLANVCANNGLTSGEVIKSPCSPNFCAPPL